MELCSMVPLEVKVITPEGRMVYHGILKKSVHVKIKGKGVFFIKTKEKMYKVVVP